MRGNTHCLEVWGDFALFHTSGNESGAFQLSRHHAFRSVGIFDAIY